MTTATLDVRNLRTHFFTRAGVVKAVDDVSFSIARGQVLGLVGEVRVRQDGHGILDHWPGRSPGRIVGGSILYQGQDLAKLSEREMRTLRGNRIAMIFQDPMMTLNPVLRIDTQMIETVRAHAKVSHAEARTRSRDALGMVGIPSPDERLAAYPHQFSGGMRQRVAIAIALLHHPDLLIADEPTTALDVTIQAQILAEVQKLATTYGTGLIWITHDLSVIAGLADDIAVMYAGRIVETGRAEAVLDRPLHPYTHGLIGECTQPQPARREAAADCGHDAEPAQPAAGDSHSVPAVHTRTPLASRNRNHRSRLRGRLPASSSAGRCSGINATPIIELRGVSKPRPNSRRLIARLAHPSRVDFWRPHSGTRSCEPWIMSISP